jgi:ATP-dependent helicase HrpB
VTPSARALPIYELEPEVLARLADGNRLILQAPTGSGKSTQVPQMLLDAGLLGRAGKVIILQPRRLAARMLAARVARERGEKAPGGEAGYRIRLDNVTSARTRIEYVTEGILLRQMLGDPRLGGVAAILFDEFHERHLYGDITLARALQIQETIRPDLKLVVMSATLETDLLAKYLAPCETLVSRGRTFPVEIEYLPRPAPFDRVPVWEQAAEALERLAAEHPQGDALIFMPGAYEISRTLAEIRASSRLGREWVALPLHGELPPAEQDAAVAQVEGRRKAVVSTNVAETSLTIDGVRLVIDSGLAKIARYDPYRGINTLLIEKISRASADQRAGRAGRTAPGRCLRLWTEAEHADRPAQTLPEVRRLDLAEVVLTLKASGVNDVHAFRWLEPPERRSLERAENLLLDLGAIARGSGELSVVGRRMLAFPVHPRYARMLLAAREWDCVRPVALLAALTQSRSLFTRSEGRRMEADREDVLGAEHESDFLLLMRAWKFAENCRFDPNRCRRLGIHALVARQVGELFEQFLRINAESSRRAGEGDEMAAAAADANSALAPTLPADRATYVQRCVSIGFSDQLARRLDAGTLRCQLVGNRRGVLARESAIQKAPLLVAAEVREIQNRGEELTTLLSLATAVEEQWLRDLFPGDFSESEDVFFDDDARRVLVRRQRRFRDLPLAESTSDDPPLEQAAALLASEVSAGRCPLKNWDAAVEQWVARVKALAVWMPELGLPRIEAGDRRALIEQICYGATTYKAIKERAIWPTVRAWLSPPQAAWIDEYAPERIDLLTSRGSRRVKLVYPEAGDGGPPVLAARIQELYDVTGGLRVAAGRVPVVIQVLAPNHRPIQVTQDLANFWRESYPKLKLELQRKYPKHEWR